MRAQLAVSVAFTVPPHELCVPALPIGRPWPAGAQPVVPERRRCWDSALKALCSEAVDKDVRQREVVPQPPLNDVASADHDGFANVGPPAADGVRDETKLVTRYEEVRRKRKHAAREGGYGAQSATISGPKGVDRDVMPVVVDDANGRTL